MYVEDAGERQKVVPEDRVEDAHEAASDTLDGLIPEEWKADDRSRTST